MAKQFAGKVVIVTGGGSGSGRTTAQDFAAAGASVVVSGRTRSLLDETVAAIAGAGGNAIAVAGDVSKRDDVQALVAAATKTFGRLDYLVNNAGINANGQLLCDADEDLFDRIYATNVRGAFLCMKYAIPEMLKNGGGAVVNVSSNQGLVGARGTAGYAASKHALNGLTKVAAIEYASQGIRVNAVCPAGTDTEMLKKLSSSMTPEAWATRVKTMYPTGEIGKVAQVSSVIQFLCTDGAAHIHGATLPIDGGFTAQ
jgi:NAD(P)-dependent dehydrogenase (short-subunit alcohol dehydrogenase family)